VGGTGVGVGGAGVGVGGTGVGVAATGVGAAAGAQEAISRERTATTTNHTLFLSIFFLLFYGPSQGLSKTFIMSSGKLPHIQKNPFLKT